MRAISVLLGVCLTTTPVLALEEGIPATTSPQTTHSKSIQGLERHVSTNAKNEVDGLEGYSRVQKSLAHLDWEGAGALASVFNSGDFEAKLTCYSRISGDKPQYRRLDGVVHFFPGLKQVLFEEIGAKHGLSGQLDDLAARKRHHASVKTRIETSSGDLKGKPGESANLLFGESPVGDTGLLETEAGETIYVFGEKRPMGRFIQLTQTTGGKLAVIVQDFGLIEKKGEGPVRVLMCETDGPDQFVLPEAVSLPPEALSTTEGGTFSTEQTAPDRMGFEAEFTTADGKAATKGELFQKTPEHLRLSGSTKDGINDIPFLLDLRKTKEGMEILDGSVPPRIRLTARQTPTGWTFSGLAHGESVEYQVHAEKDAIVIKPKIGDRRLADIEIPTSQPASHYALSPMELGASVLLAASLPYNAKRQSLVRFLQGGLKPGEQVTTDIRDRRSRTRLVKELALDGTVTLHDGGKIPGRDVYVLVDEQDGFKVGDDVAWDADSDEKSTDYRSGRIERISRSGTFLIEESYDSMRAVHDSKKLKRRVGPDGADGVKEGDTVVYGNGRNEVKRIYEGGLISVRDKYGDWRWRERKDLHARVDSDGTIKPGDLVWVKDRYSDWVQRPAQTLYEGQRAYTGDDIQTYQPESEKPADITFGAGDMVTRTDGDHGFKVTRFFGDFVELEKDSKRLLAKRADVSKMLSEKDGLAVDGWVLHEGDAARVQAMDESGHVFIQTDGGTRRRVPLTSVIKPITNGSLKPGDSVVNSQREGGKVLASFSNEGGSAVVVKFENGERSWRHEGLTKLLPTYENFRSEMLLLQKDGTRLHKAVGFASDGRVLTDRGWFKTSEFEPETDAPAGRNKGQTVLIQGNYRAPSHWPAVNKARESGQQMKEGKLLAFYPSGHVAVEVDGERKITTLGYAGVETDKYEGIRKGKWIVGAKGNAGRVERIFTNSVADLKFDDKELSGRYTMMSLGADDYETTQDDFGSLKSGDTVLDAEFRLWKAAGFTKSGKAVVTSPDGKKTTVVPAADLKKARVTTDDGKEVFGPGGMP